MELLTDVDMLLMVAKGIRDGICHAIHRYAKENNNYMKETIAILMYWDVSNL